MPNLVILALFCVKLSSRQGLVYQRSSSRSLWIDLKIDKDHLHTEMNVCGKFGYPSSILCQVIIRTRFGIPTDLPTDRPTNMSKAIYPHFIEGGHNDVRQEGHDGPVSLHWLICKMPSYQTLQYLGTSLKT